MKSRVFVSVAGMPFQACRPSANVGGVLFFPFVQRSRLCGVCLGVQENIASLCSNPFVHACKGQACWGTSSNHRCVACRSDLFIRSMLDSLVCVLMSRRGGYSASQHENLQSQFRVADLDLKLLMSMQPVRKSKFVVEVHQL